MDLIVTWIVIVAIVALCLTCGHALLSIAETTFESLKDFLCYLFVCIKAASKVLGKALRDLPFVWYPMTVLAILPACVDIPRNAALPFLVIFAVSAYLVCERPKKEAVAPPLQFKHPLLGVRLPSTLQSKSHI